jgi:DNA primase
LIKRYTNTVFISYDGDDAGKKAALRAIDILEAEQVECRIVRIPDGQDPDDFLKQHKKEGYDKLLKNASASMEYKFDMAAEKYDLSDSGEMEKYTRECIGILKKVQSAVVREKYVNLLAERTGFSVHSIMQDIGVSAGQEPVQPLKKGEVKPKKLTAAAKAENYIVALACANPEKTLGICRQLGGDDLDNEANKKMFLYILECAKRGISPNGDEILSVLTNEDELRHATRLLSSSADLFTDGKQADSYLSDCVKRVRIRSMERELEECIKAAGSETDAEVKSKMAEKVGLLTKELYRLRTKASDSPDQ